MRKILTVLAALLTVTLPLEAQTLSPKQERQLLGYAIAQALASMRADSLQLRHLQRLYEAADVRVMLDSLADLTPADPPFAEVPDSTVVWPSEYELIVGALPPTDSVLLYSVQWWSDPTMGQISTICLVDEFGQRSAHIIQWDTLAIPPYQYTGTTYGEPGCANDWSILDPNVVEFSDPFNTLGEMWVRAISDTTPPLPPPPPPPPPAPVYEVESAFITSTLTGVPRVQITVRDAATQAPASGAPVLVEVTDGASALADQNLQMLNRNADALGRIAFDWHVVPNEVNSLRVTVGSASITVNWP